MAKSRTIFECQKCGSQFPKWLGRCSECGGWNTLVESIIENPGATLVTQETKSQISSLADEDIVQAAPVATNISEFDHVVGGGLVPGSVTLIGGEPGIGKSTLVMQIVGSLANAKTPSLYASAEESDMQIRARARRLGITSDDVKVLSTSRIEDVLHHAKNLQVPFLVVDSIHTFCCDDISSSAGTVSQVRECAHRLATFAKSTNTTVILIGQVTKEGTLAGPRVLEHIVDTVLSFEGDDNAIVRTLRVNKHRFGSTEELGLFDMTSQGLVALEDPSSLLAIEGSERPSGLCVGAAVDGSRPFLVEVQALVTDSNAPISRRIVQGIEQARVSSLIAVLEQRCGIKLVNKDVYVSLVGGVKLKDAGLDLAICIAIASAQKDIAVSRDQVFAGEVGLSGEIRPSAHPSRRINEAERRGHSNIYINLKASDQTKTESVQITQVDSVAKVLADIGLGTNA